MKTFRVCLGVKKGEALAPEIVDTHDADEAIRIAFTLVGIKRGSRFADTLEVLAAPTE